ncbi:MAG: hypothetical protein IT306_25460 [Chloroflexi bacterium]|nr:hypothetical protein [Chloroflexota bacterium]
MAPVNKVIDPERMLHLAVSARFVPRFTQDVDLAVAVADDRRAEQLVLRLTASTFRIVSLLERDATGRLATVRLALAADPAMIEVVDLLFASPASSRRLSPQPRR